MPDFEWKGIRNKQYLSGSVTALTRDEAAHKLKIDGVIITSLVRAQAHASAAKWRNFDIKTLFRFRRKVNLKHVMLGTKKLATMMRSGLAILPSLAMVRDQTESPALKQAFDQIYHNVESGKNFSEALAMHPEIFDPIYVNMVRAGETSGRLDTFLDKLVANIRKTIRIRKSIKSAMMYPSILLLVAAVVVAIMMVFVVPVFAQMFASIGAQLPAPTMMVLSVSNFVRDPYGGGLLLATLIGGTIIFKQVLRRSLEFRKKWHQLLLKAPLFGELILNSNLAQISMVYGNLSGAGVQVIEALDITAESTRNEVIRESVQTAKRGVFSGEPLSKLLAQVSYFPPTFSQLVSVGEQTGNMTEMLETISSYFEEEFDSSVEKLSQMMEPLMIVFLGCVIGFILVAMYLPIFKMGQVVTGG